MSATFEKLGPYRVLGILGRGGMGTVYRGIDEKTKSEAAIKVLSPTLAADTSFRERFVAEIESLKTLRQQNIVELVGYGEEAGHLFYVMELIEGQSLQDELKNGRRFDWREVVDIGIQICAALKHAHEHGIIHRDLKPANLLVNDDNVIKLFDFGIAKLFGSNMITTDTVLGTADYMAPEQAEGKTAGQKTDLYSLGSVLYTLLTGKPPFTGKSVAEVVHKLRFDEPIPVGRFNPEIPLELEDVIEKLLKKNPDARIPTAVALSHKLRGIQESLTPDSRHDESYVVVGPDEHSPKEADAVKISDRPTVAIPVKEKPLVASESKKETRTLFVQVDSNKTRRRSNASTLIGALRLVVLIGLVGFLVYTVQLLVRPPSADQLFDQISTTIKADKPSTLLSVRPELNRFLYLFPNDPRAERIKSWQHQAELHVLHTELEVRARLNNTSPIEELYLKARNLIATDPENATKSLRALVALYHGHPDGISKNDDAANCILLAIDQLKRLETSTEASVANHRRFIEQKLKEAEELKETSPQIARQILESIALLYADNQWAEDLVESARHVIVQMDDGSLPAE